MKQEFQQAPLQVFASTLDSEMEKWLISSDKSMNCAHCFASAPPEEIPTPLTSPKLSSQFLNE